jgi:membrane protein YdbS with pleckstrin-like domain
MRRLLKPGEQLIVTTRRHSRMLAWPAIVFVLVSGAGAFAAGWLSRGHLEQAVPWLPPASRLWFALVPALLGVWIVLGYCLRELFVWRSVRYILTSRRVLRRERGLTRTDREMPLGLVRDVNVRQGFVQGMFRSGTIILSSGGSVQLTLADVPEARRFREFILEAIEDLPEDEWSQDEMGPGDEITDFSDASLPWELRED